MNVWILLLAKSTNVVLVRTRDFANVVSSPPLEITAASKIIKNCLGSDWPSKVGIMLNLYPKGHCASCKFIDKGELVSIDMNDFWEFFS